jgi:hypothetical protein
LDERRDRVSAEYLLSLKKESGSVLIGPYSQILAMGLSGEDLELAIEDVLLTVR